MTDKLINSQTKAHIKVTNQTWIFILINLVTCDIPNQGMNVPFVNLKKERRKKKGATHPHKIQKLRNFVSTQKYI